jgi:dTDP-4-dehydrorhamnose reductase
MSNHKKTIVLFGKNGQLGKSFEALRDDIEEKYQFISFGKVDGDITNIDLLKSIREKINPDFIINCAAYTAVDKAEAEPESCDLVNFVGIKNIVEIFGNSSTIIHYSTDYVYHTNDILPLYEKSITQPISVYAKSKLKGENALIEKAKKFLIIRTSWVYSPFGNNFVKTMIRLASERDKLSIVDDQIGAPTYAPDLAEDTFKILDKLSSSNSPEKFNGIYNYANEGTISWYDFAKAIFKNLNVEISLIKIKSKDYPTAAIRPYWSKMNLSKIKSTFDLQISHWLISLKKCLSIIENQ